MSKEAQAVLDSALKLSDDEREEILVGLMDSMEDDVEYPADEEYATELKRRIDDLASGKEKGIPWEEARKSIFRK